MGSFGSSDNFAFFQLYLQPVVREEVRVLVLRYGQVDEEWKPHCYSRSLEVG